MLCVLRPGPAQASAERHGCGDSDATTCGYEPFLLYPPSFNPFLAPSLPTKTCGCGSGQLTRLLRYVRCVVICSLESLLFGIARSSFTASGRWCGCTCACTCTRRASLRASAYVGTPTCAPVGVCGGVYTFVCEHVRARAYACLRACEQRACVCRVLRRP